jgi:hypothetical protein
LGKGFFGFLLGVPALMLFTRLTMFLDRLLYPGYRAVEIQQPVFLMGGRSGTTFVHRLLSETRDFPVFEAWELLNPALTARKLIRPLVDRRIKKNRHVIYTEDLGHPLTLTTVEEEELLFFHTMDTQFLTSRTPLGLDDIEYPELRFYDHQPDWRRKRSVRFFKECLKRQVYRTGKTQVVAKINYSICRIKTLLEEFPDAKFVFFLRSPYEVISSHLSQHQKMLDRHFGLENIPKERLDLYFERRYRYDVELYYYAHQMASAGDLPSDRIFLLRYDSLRTQLEETFEQFVEFAGITPTEKLREVIRRQAERQKDYKRKHKNLELEAFGISKERLARDLSFYFELYGFDKEV